MDSEPEHTSQNCVTMSSPSADLIAGYCDHLRMRGRIPETVQQRRWLLTKADRELPYGLDQADDREIAAWLYRDDLGPNARPAYYGVLNNFYRYWVGRAGGLKLNPMDDLPRPKAKEGRPRPVTDAQLAHILRHAAEPYRTWALIAAYQGARCIEISRLDRDDVTADTIWLHGKGDKCRELPTHPAVYEAVSALPPGPVARKQDGTRASRHYVSAMASIHFARDLGIPVALHRLRHWYGTAVRRRSDLRTAQAALGHADPKTTALYTEVGLDEVRAAMSALPRLTADRSAA